jgi:hypothetical protein
LSSILHLVRLNSNQSCLACHWSLFAPFLSIYMVTMVASNQSKHDTCAANNGSSRPDARGAMSSSLSYSDGLELYQINGAACNIMHQCTTDFAHVGTWISNEQHQYSESFLDNGT